MSTLINSTSQRTAPTFTFKKLNIPKIIDNTLLLTFITPLGFVINNIIKFKQIGGNQIHTQGDYILMLSSCLLGLLAAHLPLLINKVLKIEIPTVLRIMFAVFLFCSIFLGEVMSFYYLVPHWDDILHFGSSIMTGLFGVLLVSNFCRSNGNIVLPPIVIALFAFCFAVSVGGVWKIFEFAMDSFLGLNMQKTMLQNGEMLSGTLAVADTMKDVIVDTCGAMVVASTIYISQKHFKINISETINKQLLNN